MAREPQPVRPDTWQPGPIAGPPCYVADQVWLDRLARRFARDEHRAQRGYRADIGEIVSQRRANLCRQGHPVLARGFAVQNDPTGTPVDVIELQSSDLDRAQPEARHQH